MSFWSQRSCSGGSRIRSSRRRGFHFIRVEVCRNIEVLVVEVLVDEVVDEVLIVDDLVVEGEVLVVEVHKVLVDEVHLVVNEVLVVDDLVVKIIGYLVLLLQEGP